MNVVAGQSACIAGLFAETTNGLSANSALVKQAETYNLFQVNRAHRQENGYTLVASYLSQPTTSVATAADIYPTRLRRAGGTGPAAPVLAGPIFQAPTILF